MEQNPILLAVLEFSVLLDCQNSGNEGKHQVSGKEPDDEEESEHPKFIVCPQQHDVRVIDSPWDFYRIKVVHGRRMPVPPMVSSAE